MTLHTSRRRIAPRLTLVGGALASLVLLSLFPDPAVASWWRRFTNRGTTIVESAPVAAGGSWHWMRSPEQEQRVIASHYDRYCVRCHGVDGRGVWDIPDVPDLASRKWHGTRTDDQLTRAILEGRGACMPAFRGTLTLEECWAMSRYLRTFIPGNQKPRPDTREEERTKKNDEEGKEKPM